MQKKEITLIFYHIPEDRDDSEAPNVFSIPISKPDLRLKHIYQHFPLKGTYTFRFKAAYEGFIVWLDISDLQSDVPLFKDKICLKANRLSWNEPKNQPKPQSVTSQLKSNKNAQPINLFEQHEIPTPLVQKPKENGFIQMNLLEAHHGEPSSQGIKLDLFSEPKAETKKQQKEVNLMGDFENHGDLI